tara:strand:- start:287 stop:574 length:288 start_codon:yes stop_codon:yes gene_type:complete
MKSSKKSATAGNVVVSTGTCFSRPRPADGFKKVARDKAVAERERVRGAFYLTVHKKKFALAVASIRSIKEKKLKTHPLIGKYGAVHTIATVLNQE